MTANLLHSIVVAAALTGCATDATDNPDPATGTTESALSSNTRTAFNYFVHKGLTKKQSAGIIGNLIQESNVNPSSVQSGGPGRGIAQWSVGGRWDTSSGDNMTAYARRRGENRWALAPQLGFIWFELHDVQGYGLHALRNSHTIDDATLIFMRDFEICGNCVSSQRIQYAHQVYQAYAGTSTVEASSCYSPTLAADVAIGTCVVSPDDQRTYQCDGGEWVDADTAPQACTELHE
jgi:hypothetical protein